MCHSDLILRGKGREHCFGFPSFQETGVRPWESAWMGVPQWGKRTTRSGKCA